VTTSVTVVVRVSPLPVAVMVIVYVPRAVFLPAFTVSVELEVVGSTKVDGLKAVVVPGALGLMLALKATFPENPPSGVAITV
jgi:hypothetical protein